MNANARDGITLRSATIADVPLILHFIRALAEYERLLPECHATEEKLRESLFGARRVAEVTLAFDGETPAGYALYFHNYSTFLAQPGLYLEDLFVDPAHRGRGIGRLLLSHLAALAVERGCHRLEWAVLDWNADAIGFYQSVGAQPMDDWTVYRLTGDALMAMARD